MNSQARLAADQLLALETREEQRWSARETILYNLGIGLGAAAAEDPSFLRYVLEDRLITFPCMASILAASWPAYLDPRLGVRYEGVVHGEESLQIERPLPYEGNFVGRTKVEGIWGRGKQKGAVMRLLKTLHNATDDVLLAICRSTVMLRYNGDFSGSEAGAPKATSLPEREPDGFIDVATRPEQALVYRLSGDLNPLHAVPKVAAAAGFPKPILHGLCSFAVAARSMVVAVAAGDESRLKEFGVRFSSPVYPGETLRTEYWTIGDNEFAVRSLAVERGVVVLTGGRARFDKA